ncbi:chloride channel protein [Clostridium sp.]|uniref:ClC family H(+)/Cl(-) exchange transporter n=1 Tax=Clostridium sp. TaxID=1506 RepID=UPI002607B844|nr:chloride channel protein [Clostridium sp.]
MQENSIKELIINRKNLKAKLIIQGALVGILTGLVIVLNRKGIIILSKVFNKLYEFGRRGLLETFIVIVIAIFIGLLVGKMVKKEEMISGSGIPQVKGILINKISINWFRVLILKFIGGVIALGAGLSLGREGPSVQIGGTIGEGLYEKTKKKSSSQKEYLITAGASAGLAAAFNSPLAGMIFALEELHRSFSPILLLPVMIATILADFVSKYFLGMEPSLNFALKNQIPLKHYWLLIILGIITGVLGVVFSKGILFSQYIYGKFKKLKIEYKIAIPFVITAIIGLYIPKLLGGGHELILDISNNNYSISYLIITYILKFTLLLVAFGSSAPGGIFLPLLLLGSILGDIVGVIGNSYLGISGDLIINFIALGMAGYFASVVKAPITGIVLIMEMTGSFNHLLSLGVVVFISYITSDILKCEPIYDSLLDKVLIKKGVYKNNKKEKNLMEFVVEIDSFAEGNYINNIKWPEDFLIVSVKRGEDEIIPRGKVKLNTGDYIVALVAIENKAKLIEEIQKITLG